MDKPLKPCPGCKSHDVALRRMGNDHTKTRKITIKCGACRLERTDAARAYSMEWLEEVAVRNWNARAEQDKIKEE